MSVLAGDAAAMRSVAVRLRLEADEVRGTLGRIAGATELPACRGAAIERSRETVAALRERGGWIAGRLDTLAYELDHGADWLEEARAAALAAGETW